MILAGSRLEMSDSSLLSWLSFLKSALAATCLDMTILQRSSVVLTLVLISGLFHAYNGFLENSLHVTLAQEASFFEFVPYLVFLDFFL